MASGQNIRAGGAHVELWVNDRMTAGLRRASISIRRFGRLTEDVSRRLLRAGTLMAVPMAFAGRQFAMFEQQMAEVATMLDAPSHHMERFSKEIVKMSVRFGKGTDELSKGLYNILSATIDASKSLEVLEVSSKAAVAGLTDTATAARTIAGVLNAYGLSADHAGDVSDVLFTTVKRGQTTFAELSMFMGKTTSVAATAGVEFHELGAAIALVTRAGIPTEVAITGIRQALAKMVKPAHQSAVMFRKLFGMEMNPQTIKAMGGLEKFLQTVANKANTEQIAVLFPEVRALTSMLPLLRNTSELREDLESMENRAGATQKAYDKMASTVAHQFNQMKMAGKALMIVIGEELAPALKNLMRNVMRFAITSIHWVKHNGKLLFSLLKLTAKILTAGVALKLFSIVLASIATIVGVLGAKLSTLALVTGAFKGLAQSVGVSITWIEAFGAAVAVIITWKAAMLALTAVTLAFKVVWAAIVALTGTFSVLIFAIVSGLTLLGFGLLNNRSVFKAWANEIHGVFDDASMGIKGVIDAIKGGQWELATQIAVDTMKLVWSQFWHWLKEGWQNAMKGVGDIMADRASGWKSSVHIAREGLKEGIWDTADAVKSAWRKLEDAVMPGPTSTATRVRRAEADADLQRRRMAFDKAGFKHDFREDLNLYAFGGDGPGARIKEIQDAQNERAKIMTQAEKEIAAKRKELQRKTTIARIAALLAENRKRRDAAQREKDLQDMLTKGTDAFDALRKEGSKPKAASLEGLADLIPEQLDVGTGAAAGRMRLGALNAAAAIRLGMEAGAPNSWVQRNVTANERTADGVTAILRTMQNFGVEE